MINTILLQQIHSNRLTHKMAFSKF